MQPEQASHPEEAMALLSPVEEPIARTPDPAVEPAVQLPEAEEQTLIVVVQLPEETEEPKPEPRTRTGRVLAGLKKVKRGEFRELGLSPDQVLARFREKNDK